MSTYQVTNLLDHGAGSLRQAVLVSDVHPGTDVIKFAPKLKGTITLTTGQIEMFPFILHSTLAPQYSLSAYKYAAAGHGLAVAFVWWPIALILAVGCFLFIYRHYSGKVKLAQDTQVRSSIQALAIPANAHAVAIGNITCSGASSISTNPYFA
jgi:cytochrome bd-type quinol oxidase subunit 2